MFTENSKQRSIRQKICGRLFLTTEIICACLIEISYLFWVVLVILWYGLLVVFKIYTTLWFWYLPCKMNTKNGSTLWKCRIFWWIYFWSVTMFQLISPNSPVHYLYIVKTNFACLWIQKKHNLKDSHSLYRLMVVIYWNTFILMSTLVEISDLVWLYINVTFWR